MNEGNRLLRLSDVNRKYRESVTCPRCNRSSNLLGCAIEVDPILGTAIHRLQFALQCPYCHAGLLLGGVDTLKSVHISEPSTFTVSWMTSVIRAFKRLGAPQQLR